MRNKQSYTEKRTSMMGFYLKRADEYKTEHHTKAAAELEWITYEIPNGSKPAAMGFSGKRGNPDFHYTFANEERRADHIANWIIGRVAHTELVATRRRTRHTEHDLEIGDIVHCSWGYDQTNNDFWQVVKVTKCTVDLRALKPEFVETTTGGMDAGRVITKKDNFVNEVPDWGESKWGDLKGKRVTNGMIRIASFARASKWGGQSCHESWGH